MSTQKKTEFMRFNQEGTMQTVKGETVKQVTSFVYLGSEVADSESDINIRIGKAWTALNKMKTIWESRLSNELKRQFFRATVESVLLYRSVTWSFTKHFEQRLVVRTWGCYEQYFVAGTSNKGATVWKTTKCHHNGTRKKDEIRRTLLEALRRTCK